MDYKKTDLIRMIKEFCLECSGQDRTEVRLCTVNKCKLYSVRLGESTPKIEGAPVKVKLAKQPMSEAHKAALKLGRDRKKAAEGV